MNGWTIGFGWMRDQCLIGNSEVFMMKQLALMKQLSMMKQFPIGRNPHGGATFHGVAALHDEAALHAGLALHDHETLRDEASSRDETNLNVEACFTAYSPPFAISRFHRHHFCTPRPLAASHYYTSTSSRPFGNSSSTDLPISPYMLRATPVCSHHSPFSSPLTRPPPYPNFDSNPHAHSHPHFYPPHPRPIPTSTPITLT